MVKESTYEIFKKLETLPFFNRLLTDGIIPVHLLDYKVIYEFYINELETLKRERWTKNRKGQAIQSTMDEYSISKSTVYEIVKMMKG